MHFLFLLYNPKISRELSVGYNVNMNWLFDNHVSLFMYSCKYKHCFPPPSQYSDSGFRCPDDEYNPPRVCEPRVLRKNDGDGNYDHTEEVKG